MRPTKRSLIVGASGQVGAQIVEALGSGSSIATSRNAAMPGAMQLDLSALSLESSLGLICQHELDAVYCVGGMTDVDRCEAESQLAMKTNCDGPGFLAAAAATRSLPFVYFSTEYIFDGVNGPYSEDAPANPINAYGQSKWQGEQAVRDAHPSPLIIRTTVVYGPDPGERNFLYRLRNTLRKGQKICVPFDQISTPTYNRDLAKNVLALVNAHASGVFHVCGPERVSRFEFSRQAAALMGLNKSLIIGVPTLELAQKAPRPLNAGLRTEKLWGHKAHFPVRTLAEVLCNWMAK
ncbi:MAG TPA: SDR family oxidoreductase [Terracidiphilus sp.]|nr:SDR family oxidoreductase [Terracidiphilus sp.]